MSEDGSVLPQSEIDALFKQATGKSIAPPASHSAAPSSTLKPQVNPVRPSISPQKASRPAAPSAVPSRPAAPQPSSDEIKALQATVAGLAQRMAKVETTVSRRGQEEGKSPEVSIIVQQLSQGLEAMGRDLRKVNNRVAGITRGVADAPGNGIHNGFVCQSCNAHGLVAIPIRCTVCGEESWWGWWPKEE